MVFPVEAEVVVTLFPVAQEVESSAPNVCAMWTMSRLWPIGMFCELKSLIFTSLKAAKLS